MNDLISRQHLIKLLETEKEYRSNRGEIGAEKGLCYALEIVDDMASATIYGYNIEHLVLIASVLEEKNIPPEDVADVVKDMRLVWNFVLEKIESSLEKSLLEQIPLTEPPKEES